MTIEARSFLSPFGGGRESPEQLEGEDLIAKPPPAPSRGGYVALRDCAGLTIENGELTIENEEPGH